MNWSVPAAIIAGAAIIAASILFTNRWEIAALSGSYLDPRDDKPITISHIYRLDRWTGQIDRCEDDADRLARTSEFGETCPAHSRLVDYTIPRTK